MFIKLTVDQKQKTNEQIKESNTRNNIHDSQTLCLDSNLHAVNCSERLRGVSHVNLLRDLWCS